MPSTLSLNSWLDLFSPVHRQKPRFMALASAVLSQAADLLALIQDGIPEAFSLETASGRQLDALGNLINVSRPASDTSDEDYRFLLRARIAANHWNGTNETLPETLAEAFPGRTAMLKDNLNGTVTASLSGEAPFPLADLFPVPAGVRLLEE